MGILLAGVILGRKYGTLSVIVFLLLVVAGLPLLSGGRGGIGVFAGPSAGFLLLYPVVALDDWCDSSIYSSMKLISGFYSLVF